jgi:hypothetical protein
MRGGELLPGFHKEWLLIERERLHLRLHALEILCQPSVTDPKFAVVTQLAG